MTNALIASVAKPAFMSTSFTLGTGAGFDYFSDKIWFDLVLMNLSELYLNQIDLSRPWRRKRG